MFVKTSDIPFIVEGEEGSWKAVHFCNSIAGPARLYVNDILVLRDCLCEIDDISDQLALMDSFRKWRKGVFSNVELTGHLPFGSEPKLKHIYRYGPSFVKISTELLIPKTTIIRKQLGIGSVLLPGDWISYRTVDRSTDTNVTLSAWHDLTHLPAALKPFSSWNRFPLAVIFKHRNSTELEIGVETGVWRWVNGLKGPDNRSEFSLSKSDKGIHFHRYVTSADEEFEPPARPYTV